MKRYISQFKKFKESKNADIYVFDLLKISFQTQIFHWQTCSYAEHKALGKFYEELPDLVDKFVESWQGTYGIRVNVEGTCNFYNYGDIDIYSWAGSVRYKFEQIYDCLDEADTELKNILDEMKSLADTLLYLLSLE